MNGTKKNGFTLVEMLVAITVIGLLTIVSVVQFKSSQESDDLRFAVLRLADGIRTAQNAGLSGKLEKYQGASQYGIHIFKSASASSCMVDGATVEEGALLFADTYKLGTYDTDSDPTKSDIIISCISLDIGKRGVIVMDGITKKMTNPQTPDDTDDTETTLIFRRPTAQITINNGTDVSHVKISLKNTAINAVKTTSLDRLTGRIDYDF